jgi:SAM-dependent methyltransferase
MSYLKEMADSGYTMESIGPFHSVMLPHLAKELSIGRTARIADIGPAQGHCVIPLHRSGYTNIDVVDRDSYNFRNFSETFGFRCHQCDVARDPLPFQSSTFDWIICFHLIEHLENPQWFLEEAYRVLKVDGVVTLVTPDWRKQFKTFWRDPTHLRPFDKQSISRAMRMARFEDVRTSSWNSRWGFGRVQAYRAFPKLGMIGEDLLAIGYKRQ